MNPKDRYGDPEGWTAHPSVLQARAATVVLVKNIADTLERHYPGWLWAVQPDERGGVINIFSMRLSCRWGWRIKTKNIQNDPNLKIALQAGGEILERFGQKRGPYDYARWQAAPRYLGGVAMDVSDKESKIRRRYRDDEFTTAVRSGQLKLKVKDLKTTTGTYREIYIQPSALWER